MAKKEKKGFMLAELLVYMAILSVISILVIGFIIMMV
jgi:Tfp pilus assembly protein FimT